jgi:hypothetical protein
MGTRSPAAFALAVAGYIGAALAIEPHAGAAGALGIGIATWLALLVAVRPLARRERRVRRARAAVRAAARARPLRGRELADELLQPHRLTGEMLGRGGDLLGRRAGLLRRRGDLLGRRR